MNIHTPGEYDPKDGQETLPEIAMHRRKWMKQAGIAIGGGTVATVGSIYAWNYFNPSEEEVLAAGVSESAESKTTTSRYPAKRDSRFRYDREETVKREALEHTNFYEFSRFKSSWRLVDKFKVDPWKVEIGGLCSKPISFDMDQFYELFGDKLVERLYRHRCVEKWAMAVPWTGVPLKTILEAVQPKASATHVRFTSFMKPDQATNQSNTTYPWPYNEGLTIEEAKVDLAFIAVGMYGEPLRKQNGAPIRLVVPWKYGFKSGKSIVRIELVDKQPATFWNTLMPERYSFQSNVDPSDVVPWSQQYEQMLGPNTLHKTLYLNGYEKEVGHLY